MRRLLTLLVTPRRFTPVAAVLLLALCGYVAFAAISLSTVTSSSQNFDGMGIPATTSTASTLPADFRADNPATVRTVGTFAGAGTTTARAGGASLSTSAGNGIYNFGAGTATLGSSDRAVGFLSSGTATASGNLYAQFANNTGSALNGLQISYNVEKYRKGINAAGFRIQLFYSMDGSAWTSAGNDFLTAFAADPGTTSSDNTGYATAPGVTVAVTNKTLNVAIPNGSNFYLAWNYSVTSGSATTNGQALAIDDISILGIGSGPTNPTGAGNAAPATIQAGNSTLLTVAVTPGANPASTGLAVTTDLSAIGGSASQQFFDDGTNGDLTAGDNIFSFTAVVPVATSAGGKSLPAAISDAQGRSGNASIALTVTPATTSPTGIGSADPASLQAEHDTLLTVAITLGTNPVSTGVTVTGDLTAIGGGASQQFYDDGTHGDVVAGNNVFSFKATVASGTTAGAKTSPVTIADAQTRSSTASLGLTVLPPPPPTTVKISQVYGGGGNSGSTYLNDFIELFNQGSTPVSLDGWTVQATSAAGTSWTANGVPTPLSGTIQPGHYYLIQESANGGGTTPLPTPDAIGVLALSASNAKIALVASPATLSGSCPLGGLVVDFVGYGTANCSEGGAAAPTLSNTTSAVRRGNGCVDTDNNASDFAEVGPIPRDSAAPVHSCGGDPAEPSGVGIASPSALDPATNTLLTVRVTPASVPASGGVSVIADLTSVGGAAAQTFYDDGTHGDLLAGDNVFSFLATVGVDITTGAKYMVPVIRDAEGRTATAPITLTVSSPTCGVERWTVKVGSDMDVDLVNLGAHVPTTIATLAALPAPLSSDIDLGGPFANNRITPTETTVFVIDATMTFYKKETDVDYHIVLDDGAGHTLISEIPNPACILAPSPLGSGRVLVPSPLGAGIAAAREKFDTRLSAQTFFQNAGIPVRMTGVGFFDFEHGQTGVAPNAIELHPVIDISFRGNTTATLMSSANPSVYGQPVTFTATVTNLGNEGAFTPTGEVTFFDAGNSFVVALDGNGQAAFTTSALTAGPHALTVSYVGDATSLPGVSAPLPITIDPAPLTVTAADKTREFGAPDPVFTGTLTGVVPGDDITASYATTAVSTSLPGTYPIVATPNDPLGRLANYTVTAHDGVLTIVDTTPPAILSVTPSVTSIWPPDHKMVSVSIAVSASDAVDPSPACHVTGVTGNEGSSADWQIAGPLTVNLLAGRDGGGSGRIYTIGVQCVDSFGNASSSSTAVVVPHDQRK